jgi:cytochrome b pre-mRNA-processing protein 3
MLPPLFRRSPSHTIATLYGVIVAQARAPRFYEDYAVPDTVLGRFDMVVLHVVLAVRRLRDGNKRQSRLAQALFNAFCRDMDENLREMGISDQGVPKQMQRVGEAFYGRAQAYDAALNADGEGVLAQALVRNIYAGVAAPRIAASALAHYVRNAAQDLASQPLDAFERGEVRFPEPAPLAAAAE